ncbi:hypothetical protein DLP05_048 [Stenotrophomonas phage vB_SmaS_DLP_5]|uniref:Uncharacterized protein n=1 Tax=Stenotrophomonas phage vB_SmaS_DLP_5 TaxID=2044561 RepID=A0A2D2W2I3_9CAUD|nr:hypothetical protein FDJ07_gp047 [Stenotrophomonas phage vB_SmaS_DLP_5]ATS92279.1 hypothetical protein DLP05_048 [Stenotrophomonas phage vB_SmaS_DLP_5]
MAEFFCDNPKCQFHFTIPATMTPADELESLKGFSPLGENPYFPKAKQITKYPSSGNYDLEAKYQATIEGATIGIGIHALLNGVSAVESHHSAIEVDGMTITGRFCSCCMQMFDFMGAAQVDPNPMVTVNTMEMPGGLEPHQAFMAGLIDGMTQPNGLPLTLADVSSSMTYKGVKLTPENTKKAMDLLCAELHKGQYVEPNIVEYKSLDDIPVEGFDGEQLSDPFKSMAKPIIKTVDEIFVEKIKKQWPDAVMVNGKWWDYPEAKGGSKIKSGILKALMTDATHEFAMQDFDGKHGNSYEDWAKQNGPESLESLQGMAKKVGMKDIDFLIHTGITGIVSMEEDLGALKEQANQSLISKIASKLKPKTGPVGFDPKDSISTHPEFSAGGVEALHEYDFISMNHHFTLPSGTVLKVPHEGLDAVMGKLTSHFPNVTFNGKKLSVEDKAWLKEAIFTHKANTKPGQH